MLMRGKEELKQLGLKLRLRLGDLKAKYLEEGKKLWREFVGGGGEGGEEEGEKGGTSITSNKYCQTLFNS